MRVWQAEPKKLCVGLFTDRGNTRRRTDLGERITCVSVMPGGNNSRREKKLVNKSHFGVRIGTG